MPQINKAIEESNYFIACFSSDSLRRKRGVFRDELALALGIQGSLFRSETFVVPLRLEPCDIPEEFEQFQCVNSFERDGFSKLIRMLV